MEKIYLFSSLIFCILLLVLLSIITTSTKIKPKVPKEKQKIAVVVSGGGMKCAYAAGVLIALAEQLKLTEPDIAVGSSGGGASLLYYISGQYELGRQIWTELLSTGKFISLTRLYPIFDMDYLVDTVFKKQAPLDTDKILKSKTKLFLAATNYVTGQTEYLSNDGSTDIFEAARATVALPYVYNKKVNINGNEYVDGDVASSININIQKAIKEGATKILVIENDRSLPNQPTDTSLYWKIVSFIASEPIRNAIKNNETKKDYMIPENVEMFYIEPSTSTTISPIDHKQDDLKKTFKLGYDDATNNNALKEFIK